MKHRNNDRHHLQYCGNRGRYVSGQQLHNQKDEKVVDLGPLQIVATVSFPGWDMAATARRRP